MKNILFILLAVITLALVANSLTSNNLIPDEAIRIRVIANSNSEDDQALKWEIKEDIEKYLYTKLDGVENIEEADALIKKNIPKVKELISQYTKNYKLNYGMNYFPKKEFRGINYEAGEYQSLVVTLGNGLGDNWWCVLFPPLCLLEAEESSDVEYRSFVMDMISKYFPSKSNV